MKKWLQRILPDRGRVLANRRLSLFGQWLHDPNLWHLNRHSVAGATAVGLFVMFMPTLGHTPLAAALAIWWRVNLPIAILLAWISNPVTIPPMFYAAYLLGCRLLGETAVGFGPAVWLDWHHWLRVLWPLTLGCVVCGALCSASGWVTVQMLWRWRVVRRLRRRRRARAV